MEFLGNIKQIQTNNEDELKTSKLTFLLAPGSLLSNCLAQDNSARRLKEKRKKTVNLLEFQKSLNFYSVNPRDLATSAPERLFLL
jgi:hypothetical protein